MALSTQTCRSGIPHSGYLQPRWTDLHHPQRDYLLVSRTNLAGGRQRTLALRYLDLDIPQLCYPLLGL